MTKIETNVLQMSLSEAIKQRRDQINKHDIESEGSEESDWSD
jgi:hypothetical protein